MTAISEQEKQDLINETHDLLKKTSESVSPEKKPKFIEEVANPVNEVLKDLQLSEDKDISDSHIKKIYSSGKSVAQFSQLKDIDDKLSRSIDGKLKRIRIRLEKILRRFSLTNPKSELEFQALLHWFELKGDEEDLNLINNIKQQPLFRSKKTLEFIVNAEEGIRMRVKGYFQLLGYGNPFDEYPASVVPIGDYKGKFVAVYPDSSDPFLLLDRDYEYIEFDDKLKQSLKDFNYSEYKLFAYSQDKVIYYPISEEKEFYSNLLKDKNLSADNPFIRYSFAKVTEDIDVIQQEIVQCIKYLQSKSPDMIPSWYDTEKERFSALWKQNNLEFPSEDKLKSLALQN